MLGEVTAVIDVWDGSETVDVVGQLDVSDVMLAVSSLGSYHV
jgi:hypothetical protein